jgi:hypothetical protein
MCVNEQQPVANRKKSIAENGQLLPMRQPITVDAGQKIEAIVAA